MKKQINIYPKRSTFKFFLFVFALISTQVLFAQQTIWTALQKQGYDARSIAAGVDGTQTSFNLKRETKDPVKIDYSGHYFDLVLPTTLHRQYLRFQARGGDGITIYNGKDLNGGQGAFLDAIFPIGGGGIPAGSKIRFLVGGKGGDQSAGGGGTGVVYQAKGTSEWKLLMVAGGGGGAGGNTAGSPGELGTAGGQGGLYSSNYGGTNGSDGATRDDGGKPGKGILSAYHNNEPVGSKGNSWGFGGGGDKDFSGYHSVGGGGGGYSGGSAGADGGSSKDGGGGGGGGSYINDAMAINKAMVKNGTTSDSKDGYITFEFTDLSFINPVSIRPYVNHYRCLDNSAGSNTNFNNIQLWLCQDGNQNQAWSFDGTTIKWNPHPDKCLDLDHSITTNGNNIQLFACNDTEAQRWTYDKQTMQIRSGIDPDKCIDVSGGGTANGTNIQIWDCQDGNTNQQFIFKQM